MKNLVGQAHINRFQHLLEEQRRHYSVQRRHVGQTYWFRQTNWFLHMTLG